MWILGDPDTLPQLHSSFEQDLERTMPDTPFALRAAAFREGNVIIVPAYEPWKLLPRAVVSATSRATHAMKTGATDARVPPLQRLLTASAILLAITAIVLRLAS